MTLPLDEQSWSRVANLTYGPWRAALVQVIATLGIPDLLADGPQSAEALAATTGVHGGSLYRVLRACATIGLLEEHASACFGLTAMGHHLRTDVEGSLHRVAVSSGLDMHWRLIANLVNAVKTGENVFERLYGESYFDHLTKDAAATHNFGEVMHDVLSLDVAWLVFSLVEHYDMTSITRVVDVGGGTGGLIGALLSTIPELHGVLFDLPTTMQAARQRLETLGVVDRCRALGGSFFDMIPGGGDLYLIRTVLHDWDDARALEILRNCRKVISGETPLVIIERVLRPGENDFGSLLDLQLMLGPGGAERTEEEWRSLLDDAGFRVHAIRPTLTPHCLIDARVQS